MSVELGYWALRGLGEPSRMLLRYTDTEWKDAAIPVTEEGGNCWFNDLKYTSGLDFPNLPYLIDGDVKVTQSLAVIRYLARKFDLFPSTADATRGDMFEQYIFDIRQGLSKVANNPDFENVKVGYIEKIDLYLREIAAFIGAGPYALGEKLTYVDFLALEFLDHIRALSPDHFKAGPVVEYMGRLKNLPPLKKFYESEDCTHKTYLILRPSAPWNGDPKKANKDIREKMYLCLS